ncbi:hypothetical protein ACFLYU_00460 [Candidatus Dependentiae bacterium]
MKIKISQTPPRFYLQKTKLIKKSPATLRLVITIHISLPKISFLISHHPELEKT